MNVISDLEMGVEYTYSKTVLATKEIGSEAKEKVGACTNMLTHRNIPVNTTEGLEKEQGCTNTTITKSTKEIGKKIRKMATA